MRRIIFTLAIAATFCTAAFSQKVNLESAITYFRNGDELSMKDAKVYIDKAASNEETNMKPKTWYYRGAIYSKIATDEKLKYMDSNAAEKALSSFITCLEVDKKLEYYNNDEADETFTSSVTYMVEAAFNAFNVSVTKLNKGDYAGALKIYDDILKGYKYDSKSLLTNNNLSRKKVWELTAYANTRAGNTARSKELYNILIDSNYREKSVYTSLYNLYMNDKDTAKALIVLEKAQRAFVDDPIFSEIEIQLYLAGGNNKVFIEKVSQKIESNPDNGRYYYYRGMTYEDVRGELINKKAPASSIDSINKLIEPDYKKAVELNEYDTFAQYNLGAFYFNQSVAVINKIGKLNDKSPDYKTKLAQLEADKKALFDNARPHLEKAYDLKDNDYQIALALQHLYEQLKMPDKAKEFEAKAKALKPVDKK